MAPLLFAVVHHLERFRGQRFAKARFNFACNRSHNRSNSPILFLYRRFGTDRSGAEQHWRTAAAWVKANGRAAHRRAVPAASMGVSRPTGAAASIRAARKPGKIGRAHV